MDKKNLYLFLLILGTAFWGVSFTFVKVGVGEGSPFAFLFFKFFVATLCLIAIFFNQLKYITKKTFRISILIGTPLLIGTILQTIGLKYTTVSNAAFITGLDVILIPVLKLFIYKKKVLRKVWFACALALTGLYIIVVKDDLTLNVGDFWILACALAFALYVLQVGKYSNEERPMPSVILLMLFCTVGCFVFALFDTNTVWLPDTNGFWTAVLFAALPATAYMYAIQNAGQRYLGEEKIALTYLFEPVFATVAGIVILKEALSTEIIIGGIFIISAMIISEVNFKKLRSRMFSQRTL
ncbi:DMT family transporter [Flavobacterium acetivorans]|uniref:DMT family transporter n=1 Tax=Flavobacterium acetivorans TaxID=2893883 RepID=UPI001E3CB064|nr:DMT family transporter [Flavobacterium sp. F-29]UFH34676.1 DMT family transporter [Flavobacterium sp. F-29]